MKKIFFLGVLLVSLHSGAQVTSVTYDQRVAYYTSFGNQGGTFNNSTDEVGMWANAANSNPKEAVAWREFKTAGDGTGSNRSLRTGDKFTLTVYGTRAYNHMGFSLNATAIPSTQNFANRYSNSRLFTQAEGPGILGTGNWGYWFYNNGSNASYTGTPGSLSTTGYDHIFTTTLTTPDRANITVTVNGTTYTAYDVVLSGSGNIAGYSLYLNDDYNGSANSNLYWKPSTGVQNTQTLDIGLSNTSFSVSEDIPDGNQANSTSATSVNNMYKKGTGTLTLKTNPKTYTGTTTIENGTLITEVSMSSSSITVNNGTVFRISGDATVNSIVNNGTLIIDPGVTLTVNGTYSGSGWVRGDVDARLSIAGSGVFGTLNFENGFRNLRNLVINRSSSGIVTLGTDLQIERILTLSNGVLKVSAGNQLTLGNNFNAGLSRSNGSLDISAAGAGIRFNMNWDLTVPAGTFSTPISKMYLNTGSASNVVTLNETDSITASVTFIKGKIVSSSVFVFSDGSTYSGATDSSFIDAPVTKTGNTAFVFPVGKIGTGLQALGISAPANSTDAFTVEYKRISPYALGYLMGTGLTKVSGCEYWQLDRTNGNAAVVVSLYGNANSGCLSATGANYFTGGGASLNDLRVCRFNTSNNTWEITGSGAVTTGTSPDVVTTTNAAVSSFSPFTFGSIATNPLPVTWIRFTATSSASSAILHWTTATERNNDHFEIERSSDGVKFIKTGEVAGAVNSLNNVNYSFTDPQASRIGNRLYYRLKQVDVGGAYSYSEVVAVDFSDDEKLVVQASPNPFGNFITFQIYANHPGEIQISLTDLQSRTVYTETPRLIGGNNRIMLETGMLANGIYLLQCTQDGVDVFRKMLVKE